MAFGTNWVISYQVGQREALVPVRAEVPLPVIKNEKGTFLRSKHALEYAQMPVDEKYQRSLRTYYDNRAYHGAPPSIPHPVEDEMNVGGQQCLKCHENGGFVARFSAYAPITPHPEMVNCRQCHVTEEVSGQFAKGLNFDGAQAPAVGAVNQSLVSSPPAIPHEVQLRENCLSCHAGPSAPKEIRVSHPERINCRQCHVFNEPASDAPEIFESAYGINK